MTKKKSIWAFVLAFMLVVPAMFLFSACGKHKHSFSGDWSKSETQHWHACTGKNCEEKSDLGDHDFVWVEKTPAGVHTDKVETGTCSTCQYQKDRTIEGSGANIHSWEWKANEHKHWQETTCEHETPLKQNEQDHTWVYESEGELTHKRTTNCGAEKHASRTEIKIAHRYTDVNDVDCNDCGYVRSLTGKGSFNAIAAKTYNAGAQGVALSDYTVDEKIKDLCEIQYKEKGADDSTYTTTAPTNAGTYEVRIYCNGNSTYLKGEVAKTELKIKGAFVKVNNQYPLKDNGGSNLYIDLVNVTVSGGSLAQSKKLTLRVLKSNAEEFSGIGRHEIDYLKGKLVFVDADSPNKPVNKNYIPTFNNFNAATIYLLRYSTENTTIKMETPSTANVTYTSNLVTFNGMKVETGFIKRGDYVTFDNYKTILRVGDMVSHNYIVEGEQKTYGIKFDTDGKSKEFWEGLVDKTFTKIETLNFVEGKNYTNTVSRQLNKGESFYLSFTTDASTSVKTYRLNFDTNGTGYVTTSDSVVFHKKDGTGVSGGYELNLGATEKEGVYFVKVTKTADSEAGKESVNFYITKR